MVSSLEDKIQIMDNLGFDNSSTNSRKLGRSVSVNVEAESFPLYKTPSLLRWRRSGRADPETMLEEEFPSDEFMECGPSPPADHTPNIYESFEEFSSSGEITVPICYDTLKKSLYDYMKSSSGRQQLLDDIESKKTTQENLNDVFKGATKFEINVSYLWSALLKRWDLLEGLLGLGAQINFYEPNHGLSALHLAAFSGCIPGTQYLLSKGN